MCVMSLRLKKMCCFSIIIFFILRSIQGVAFLVVQLLRHYFCKTYKFSNAKVLHNFKKIPNVDKKHHVTHHNILSRYYFSQRSHQKAMYHAQRPDRLHYNIRMLIILGFNLIYDHLPNVIMLFTMLQCIAPSFFFKMKK